MLASNVSFTDMEPVQWGRFNEIIGLFVHKLPTGYVLYDQSQIINIDLGGTKEDIEPYKSCRGPAETAAAIFLNHPGIDKVETYELSALTDYCQKVSFESDHLDSDVYFGLCQEELRRLPGINSFYRNRQSPRLNPFDFLPFLERNNPLDYFFTIGIYRAKELFFSLLIEISEGKIKLVSTFEHFQTLQIPPPLFTEHQAFAEQLLKSVPQKGEIIFLTYDLLKELAEAATPGTVFINALRLGHVQINSNSLGLFDKFLTEYTNPNYYVK